MKPVASESLSGLRARIRATDGDAELRHLAEALSEDGRAGARALAPLALRRRELLRAERPYVAMCGALALENMAEVSPRGTFWPGVAADLLEAYDASAPGSAQEEWITHLIRLAPTSTWAR